MGACLISAGGQNKKTEEALLHIKCNIYPAYSRHTQGEVRHPCSVPCMSPLKRVLSMQWPLSISELGETRCERTFISTCVILIVLRVWKGLCGLLR